MKRNDWPEQQRRIAMAREMLASGEGQELREAHHCTLDQFAELMAVPPRALARWECGAGSPNTHGALAWWKAMAVLEVKP